MRLLIGLILILTPLWSSAQMRAKGKTIAANSRAVVPNQGSTQEKLRKENPEDKAKYRLFWSMQMGGQVVRDELANQRTQASAALNFGLDYDFTEYFSLMLNPRVNFRNGHVQAATSSNGRENSLELINAAANLSDKNYYLISAGALDLTAVHSSLLVASTFPAVRLQVSTGDQSEFSASAIGIAAVPSSATMTSNSRDYDKTPSFGSAGVRLNYRSEMLDALLQVSQFQYRDIPLNVSTDSSFLGNTPLGSETSPQSEFRYQFQGVEARTGVALPLTRRFRYRMQFSYVQNQQAPTGYNQGYMFSNEADVVWNSRWMFMPYFAYFRVDPDATVANYNDSMTTTNRIGYAGGLTLQYQRRFRIGVLTGEREVLFLRSSQARERFMSLTLETLNVSF